VLLPVINFLAIFHTVWHAFFFPSLEWQCIVCYSVGVKEETCSVVLCVSYLWNFMSCNRIAVNWASQWVPEAQCTDGRISCLPLQQQQQQQAQQSVAATMQTQPVIAPAPMPSQSGTTTITTMSTLHQPLQHPKPPPTPQPLAQHPGVPHSAQMQQVSEWGHGRVSHPGVSGS
jgi:hypothetical protein